MCEGVGPCVPTPVEGQEDDVEAHVLVDAHGRAGAPSTAHDVVFLPFHWAGEGRANSLTHAALDPTSRMPEFKACAVRLEAAR